MNFVQVYNDNDLYRVFDVKLNFVDRDSSSIDEILVNTYEIGFSSDYVESLTLEKLKKCIESIINFLSIKIDEEDIEGGLIFYIWFDRMNGHLCFNVISGRYDTLPFSCAINLVDAYTSILEECLKGLLEINNNGADISLSDIQFFDKSDSDFEQIEDEDFVMNVYAVKIFSS